MNWEAIHKVYFIGIGGIGMSALARYFRWLGKEVGGYDKTATSLTAELEKEGMAITYTDSEETLFPDADLVVWTPAIPRTHKQFNYYLRQGTPMKKRSEVLGEVANSKYNISIAGSHGKTSTASITSHILHEAGKDVTALLGGVCLNYNSNFLPGGMIAVVEADEFDRSFLWLKPDIGLITAVDTDHLDIYGSFENIVDAFGAFTTGIREGGKLILHSSVSPSLNRSSARVYTYGLEDASADFRAENLRVQDGIYTFDVLTPQGRINDLHTGYGGRHNIENAIGAIAIACQFGIPEPDIRRALSSFRGVRRRFETHIRSKNLVYIDDYAHHPREIDAALRAAAELYPGRHITAVFQPHLYSRTRDLAEGFARSLSVADRVILLDIYPAREEPIPGVTAALIYDKLTVKDKQMSSLSGLISQLEVHTPDVLLTIGAGDIDTQVEDIVQRFKPVES